MDRLGLLTRRGALVGLLCALALVPLPGLLGGAGSPGSDDAVQPLVSEALASPTAAKRKTRKRPNVIVITTDDQSRSVYGPRFMPETFRTFGRHRDTARFTQALALPPVCCPYRAAFLAGQYPHNNGLFRNKPGYEKLRAKRNVLPVWLQRQGYYTAVVGKYLNGSTQYLARKGEAQAPGWDEWFVRSEETNAYFDVQFRDRRTAPAGDSLIEPANSKYFTDVVTRRTLRFLERRAAANRKGKRQPFFLWLPHLAPHPGLDETGDQNACSRHRFPSATNELLGWARKNIDSAKEIRRLPAFNEADNSDKPPRTRQRDRLDADDIELIRQGFECSAAAVRGVDLSNAAIWKKLGELDMRRETIIVFTSDNGYFYGEQRYGLTKGVSYEPALRIPLMIKVPPRYNKTRKSPPAKVGAITGQIDLAPTILDYAGAPKKSCKGKRQCRTMDGRSLRALLGDSAKPKIGRLKARRLAKRAMLIERVRPCFWPALRTPRFYYSIDPVDGRSKQRDCGKIAAHEVYDLRKDPAEERNLAARKRWRKKIRRKLLPKLLELRQCTGIERRDKPHPRKPYCD